MRITDYRTEQFEDRMASLDRDPEANLVRDDTSYKEIFEVLSFGRALIRFLFFMMMATFLVIVLNFFFGRELSAWAVDYSGSFIEMIPESHKDINQ